jgi:Asp-tRNA(Asn)/Glu-tRNA(Gln) amidotransferase A subunit family amidase
MEADLAKSFAGEYEQGKSKLSVVLQEMIERGQQVSDSDYQASVDKINDYGEALDEIFDEYDAILTPATPGPAPVGLQATGSPVMNTIWTFCGTPALTMPLLESPEGLPIGVQLVGASGDDARLFRTSRWLLNSLND